MTQLSVDNTLKQLKDNSIAELAVELGFEEDKIENILKQWHTISFVKWDITTTDTVQFWAHVLKYKDAAGFNTYKDIADLAITVLSLPHSNAEVERMFSQMNIIKNKLRNRLASTTLNSILLIRNQLKILKRSCHSYVLPDDVLTKITKTIKKPSTSTMEPSTSAASAPLEVVEVENDAIDNEIFACLDL